MNAIVRLQEVMRELPQMEMRTEHYFCDGLYGRKVYQPAGSLVVGKVHKKENFFIVLKGRIQIACGDSVKEHEAGEVLKTVPGDKRAVLALEDAIYMNVHHTKKKNLVKIEKEMVEPDHLALFDASNKLKALPCPG